MFLTICQAWHKVRKLSANNGQKSPRKKSEHIRKTFSSHSPYNPLLKPQLSSIYLELMKVTYCYIYYLCKISNLTTYWCPWLWRRCSPCQEFSEHTRIRHRQRSARAHATWYIKKYVSGAVVNLLQERRRRDSVFPRCIGSLISVPLADLSKQSLIKFPYCI